MAAHASTLFPTTPPASLVNPHSEAVAVNSDSNPSSVTPFTPTKDAYRGDFENYAGTEVPHGGADFAKAEGALKGTPVATPWDGKVVGVKDNGRLGNRVVVEFEWEDGKRYYAHFCHLGNESAFPEVGTTIKKGDIIGVVGNTGTKDNHLHLEVTTEMTYTTHYVNASADKSIWKNPYDLLP